MSLLTNLVSYWKLDEASGDAADSHGSNTLTNADPVAYGTGILNNGAAWTGVESQGLAITDASQSGLDLSTALTFSLWVNFNSLPGTQTQLINKLHQPGNESYFFALRPASSPNLRLSVDGVGDGTGQDVLGVDWSPSTATWYHLAVTWTGSDKTAKLYIDGTQSGTDQVGTLCASIFNGTADFSLGFGLVDVLDATLDEVGVWSRALSASEISQLYNSGSPLPYSSFAPAGRPGDIMLTGVGS